MKLQAFLQVQTGYTFDSIHPQLLPDKMHSFATTPTSLVYYTEQYNKVNKITRFVTQTPVQDSS